MGVGLSEVCFGLDSDGRGVWFKGKRAKAAYVTPYSVRLGLRRKDMLD